MKSHLSVILHEQIQHLTSTIGVIVECSVQNPYVFDSVCRYVLQARLHLFDALISHRLLASAYAEGACVEATSCGLQLHKRLVPFEELAFLGIFQCGKICHPGNAVVVIDAIGRGYPAKAFHISPSRLIINGFQQLRKRLFAFSFDDGSHERVSSEKFFIISQEFRSSADYLHVVDQLDST